MSTSRTATTISISKASGRLLAGATRYLAGGELVVSPETRQRYSVERFLGQGGFG